MSLLEECSYEEDGESPLLDSNNKRKQAAANAANNAEQQGISSSQKSRQGGKDQDDLKKNSNSTKIENETTERGRSTGKKQTKTRQSFGRHFGSLPHQKSIILAKITKVKRQKNNSLMKNFCFFSDSSNHEQMMKQMYDESLVEWRKFQNSRINEPKKMQIKETMSGTAKSLQLSVGGQKKFTLKDLQKIKKDENGNQEDEDKDVKSIGMVVRRKSCCCSQCGQLNSQQLQLADVPFVPTQHKKFYDIKYRIKTILAAPIRPPIRSSNTPGGTIIIQKSQPASTFAEQSGFANSPRAVNGSNSMHKIIAGFENNINSSLNSNNNNNNNNINITISSSSSRPSIKPSRPDNIGFISATSNTSIEKNANDENVNVSSKQNQVVKFKERNSQRESSIFNSAALIPIPQMAESTNQMGSSTQNSNNNYANSNNSGYQKQLIFQPFNDSQTFEIKRVNRKKNQQYQAESALERSQKERTRGMRALDNVLHNTKELATTPKGESSSAFSSARKELQMKSKIENGNPSKENSESEFNKHIEQSQPKMESLSEFRDRYLRSFQDHPITTSRGISQEKLKRQTRDMSGFSLPGTTKHSNNSAFHGDKYDKYQENDKRTDKIMIFSDTRSPVLSSPYFVELKGEEYNFDQRFNKKTAYQRVFSPPLPEELQLEIPSPSRPDTLNSQRNRKGNSNHSNSNANNPGSLSQNRRNLSSSDLFSGGHKESAASTARSAKFSCYYKPFRNFKLNNLQSVSKNNQNSKQQQPTQSYQGSGNIQGPSLFSGQNTLSNLPALENNSKTTSISNSQLNKHNHGNAKSQEVVDSHNSSVKGMEQHIQIAKSFGQLSSLKGSHENSLYNTKSFKELDSLLLDNNNSKHSARNAIKVQVKPKKNQNTQFGNNIQDKNMFASNILKSEK